MYVLHIYENIHKYTKCTWSSQTQTLSLLLNFFSPKPVSFWLNPRLWAAVGWPALPQGCSSGHMLESTGDFQKHSLDYIPKWVSNSGQGVLIFWKKIRESIVQPRLRPLFQTILRGVSTRLVWNMILCGGLVLHLSSEHQIPSLSTFWHLGPEPAPIFSHVETGTMTWAQGRWGLLLSKASLDPQRSFRWERPGGYRLRSPCQRVRACELQPWSWEERHAFHLWKSRTFVD